MPILCLEGPSAVGKTTTAAALAAASGACVVPEVNALFERPADEPPTWYFERQVERWALAVEGAQRRGLAVLDGDPFQPLWYAWAYGYAGWAPLDAMEAFYRPRLVAGALGFPDLYVVLGADEAALRRRRQGDRLRLRRGFEAHLRFVEPQRRYFRAVQRLAPRRVRFLDARTIEGNVEAVSAALREAQPERRPVRLFDAMVGWLREHPAL